MEIKIIMQMKGTKRDAIINFFDRWKEIPIESL